MIVIFSVGAIIGWFAMQIYEKKVQFQAFLKKIVHGNGRTGSGSRKLLKIISVTEHGIQK